MRLAKDRRGLVLSGVVLLLVLPAMMLATSLFAIIEMGGETVALQASSDKVFYTGRDVERIIENLWRENMLHDNTDDTLRKLADNYRAATGLLVDMTPTWIQLGENVELNISLHIRDPRGAAQYLSTVEL